MIIDNTYFKGEIYIPHAKPSITDSTTGVKNELNYFIDEYERDCLIKCLGYDLFLEFESKIDINKPNKLKDDAEAKWNDLMNGKEYTDPQTSRTVKWRGLRFKETSNSDFYKSFLAYYVYFYHEKDFYITRTNAGHQKEKSKNSIVVPPIEKASTAWNKFVKLVQGDSNNSVVIKNRYGVGVDFYVGGADVSLYKFILDSNAISENTYENFNPRYWEQINAYGI